MKIKISYFYNVRFFKPNQIPVSTALFDPKWYHEFKSQNHTFRDKNNVINGVRLDILSPTTCDGMCYGTKTEKRGKGCTEDSNTCLFIKTYKEQLDQLDFDLIMSELQKILDQYNGDEIILLVHEATYNLCSERKSIVELFKKHNIEVKEFQK